MKVSRLSGVCHERNFVSYDTDLLVGCLIVIKIFQIFRGHLEIFMAFIKLETEWDMRIME
jgi:hypothetical protein